MKKLLTLLLFFSGSALAQFNNNNYSGTNFVGEVLVTTEASQLFKDTFEASFDTVNNWNTPTSAGGGVGEAFSPGGITLGTGTTANGYSYVTTRPTFPLVEPAFVMTGLAINIPTPLPTNTYGAWGTFTPTATPTVASPIQEGCGFEVQPGGKMYVVCYAGAVRNVIQDLSKATGNGKQPVDGITHRYIQWFAGDLMYWAIDMQTNIVASQQNGVNGPNVNTQPASILAVAGTSNPSSSLTISVASVWVGDTGHNGNQISDGTYSWRKAIVGATGALKIDPSGGSVVGTLTTATVTSTSGQVIAANTNRKSLLFQVTNAQDVTCVPGAGPAVFGTGIILQGGSGANKAGMSILFSGPTITSAFQCIVASTSGTLQIIEGN